MEDETLRLTTPLHHFHSCFFISAFGYLTSTGVTSLSPLEQSYHTGITTPTLATLLALALLFCFGFRHHTYEMTVANRYVCGQIQLRDRADDGQIHLRADRYLTVTDRPDTRLAYKLMT